MNGDGLRAPLETGARESTPWDNRTICRDGLRAPLETSAREQTPWGHRIEPGANDPSTWRDRATGDGSTEESPWLRWALEVTIRFLDILLDALQHIERRILRQEKMVPSPVHEV